MLKEKLEELQKRVLFTLFMFGVYRIASQVPTPGIDGAALTSFFQYARLYVWSF